MTYGVEGKLKIVDTRKKFQIIKSLKFAAYGKFLPDMAHLSGELKKLNSTKNAYFWTEIHEAEFKKLKGAGSDRNSRLLRPE